ncbi:Integral membrane protein involved in transport between the late Golgi and endosome [Plasmopara halstedii]|uniref:Integral membrane protein involved in transport between the late Golgi and endosome n=1 Tax=Plasmopara halstedii TaxID=4781 RepID=A0A0P1ALU8_PLAHL|nr:Integral membrane protein involved in transport between the late Golgi and endosome [Plasmopara halstedii]CEG42086.1 Integral membrane protein involved in transport between the late Golgi and endosome [Plasmopara halstedii]|eukprot:XP_024578455.1 Integral membrane protein involved in transport between the late Golgi and endosome [Plasmopara halstedii]
MQCSHYLAQGLILGICHGTHVSMDQFFAYHTQTIVNVDGLKNCFAVVVASVVSAVCLVFFVERAKKCLDFGVTLYFLDFLAQCFYSEFPKMWDWWLLHFLAASVTIVLGEYLCSRRELEEIPVVDLFTKHSSRKI